MSRRGVPRGPNKVRFDRLSRRQDLAGRNDVAITAMTYLRASKITVVAKAQLLRALIERKGLPE
jgi:hypothetical protein